MDRFYQFINQRQSKGNKIMEDYAKKAILDSFFKDLSIRSNNYYTREEFDEIVSFQYSDKDGLSNFIMRGDTVAFEGDVNLMDKKDLINYYNYISDSFDEIMENTNTIKICDRYLAITGF
jgi:hypothetical protein